MDQTNRRFSRKVLIGATLMLAGMLVGGTPVQANPADNVDAEVILPPFPDLRTPDQVRWWERMRNRQVYTREVRQAKNEARRDGREAKSRAVVNRPQADPATALAQVSSQKDYAVPAGNVEAPATINGGTLKPFNSGSVFIRNGQQVYQGDGSGRHRSSSSAGNSSGRKLKNGT
tara:strand:+ start:448 stop:969 length:522 start_codon:yes stop_codon:yes gene_type:complete